MNDSVRDAPFSFSCVCVCVFVRDREQLSLYESVELALCPSNPLLSLLSWRVLAMIWAFKVKEKPRPQTDTTKFCCCRRRSDRCRSLVRGSQARQLPEMGLALTAATPPGAPLLTRTRALVMQNIVGRFARTHS